MQTESNGVMSAPKYATVLVENNGSNVRVMGNTISFQNWGQSVNTGLTGIAAASNVTVMTIVGCNVGIGSSAPSYALDVVGNLNLTGTISRNGSPLAATNWLQNGSTTYLSSGSIGIGTTNAVGNDIYVAGTISASNVVVRNSVFISNDNQAVRNALQLTPCKSNIVVGISDQSSFALIQNGLYTAHASNTDVYQNGVKLVYQTPTLKDYDLTWEWYGLSNTRYIVNLVQPAKFGDVVDVAVWPSFYSTASSMRAGYVYQTFSGFQWQTQGQSNVFLNANVGIGTTLPLAPLHLVGDVNVNGNTVFSNGIIQNAALSNINSTTGQFGNATTIPIINVDAKGRVTSVVATPITFPISSQFTTSGANIYILNSNVGIGTATPLAPLHVQGNVNVNGNVVFSNGLLQDAGLNNVNSAVGTYGDATNVPRITVDAKGRVTNVVATPISATGSQFTTSGTNVYILNSNVGINTNNPQYPLDVNGATRVTGWISRSFTVTFPDLTANAAFDIASFSAPTMNFDITVLGAQGNMQLSKSYNIPTTYGETAPFANGTWYLCIPFTQARNSTNVEDGELLVNVTSTTVTFRLVHSVPSVTSARYTINIICRYPTNTVPTVSDLTANAQTTVAWTSYGICPTTPLTQRTGNVGVGTTIPNYKLQATTGDASYGIVHTTGTVSIGTYLSSVSASGVAGQLGTLTNHKLGFFVNGGSPNLIIDTAGNVGVGTTSPGLKLDVTGDIRASGDITAFSDARLKDKLVRLDNAVDRVLKLTGYTYNRVDGDDGKRYAGLIAQEVERVLPEVVRKASENDYMSVAYGNMAALFVEAFKELHDDIAKMKADIAMLKNSVK